LSRRSVSLVIEERATVVAVGDGRATVEIARNEHCAGCGLCSVAGGKGRLTLDAIPGLETGQTVVVAVHRSASLRSIFLLFGLPASGLVTGALIGRSWPLAGLSAEASAAVLALGLLAATFAVAVIYDRTVAAKTAPRPTLLRTETP